MIEQKKDDSLLARYFEFSDTVTSREQLYSDLVREYGSTLTANSFFVEAAIGWGDAVCRDNAGRLGYNRKIIKNRINLQEAPTEVITRFKQDGGILQAVSSIDSEGNCHVWNVPERLQVLAPYVVRVTEDEIMLECQPFARPFRGIDREALKEHFTYLTSEAINQNLCLEDYEDILFSLPLSYRYTLKRKKNVPNPI